MEIGEYEERSLELLKQILAELREIKANGYMRYPSYPWTYPTPSWWGTGITYTSNTSDGTWQKRQEE